MKMICRASTFLFAVFFFAGTVAHSFEPDVRNSRWGDSLDAVKEVEGDLQSFSGEGFGKIENILGINCVVRFKFLMNQLKTVEYGFKSVSEKDIKSAFISITSTLDSKFNIDKNNKIHGMIDGFRFYKNERSAVVAQISKDKSNNSYLFVTYEEINVYNERLKQDEVERKVQKEKRDNDLRKF